LRNRLVVNPAHDKLGDFLAFPLRSHVASTVNSCEVESTNVTLVANEVASNLAVNVPRFPLVLNGEVERFDPTAGALGGDSTVSVTREEEDLIVILKHNLVDPERGLKLEAVLAAYFITAHAPALN
jgi:hypothetical protein